MRSCMTQIKHQIKVTENKLVENGAYYFDFSDYTQFTEKSVLYKKNRGLYLVNLKEIYTTFYKFKKGDVEFGNLQVVNTQVALGYINLYVRDKSIECLEKAISIEAAIRNRATESSKGLFLYNDFYQPLYMLQKNWLSGMAQGEYVSLCLLLLKHTSDKKYLIYARNALRVMLLDVHDGGCKAYLNGDIWFEEYVNVRRNSYVLNGNVFSVLGLYDYVNNTGEFMDELKSSLECLIQNTPLFFKYNNASRYDLREAICDSSYNHLHEIQFQVLSDVFLIPSFAKYAHTFSLIKSHTVNSPLFLLKKNYFRLVKLIRYLIN